MNSVVFLFAAAALLVLPLCKGACAPTGLTVEEKLKLVARDNDEDGNGVVTTSDIAYDITNRYDTNKDGRVDETEWVARWTCAYGDTKQFARWVWGELNQGASYMDASQFAGEPFHTGIPLDNFIAMNRQRYIKFASSG